MKASSRLLIAVALVLPLAGGCKKKKNDADQGSAGSGMAGSGMASGSDMAGSGSAMAGSGSDMAGSGSAMAGSGSGSDMAGSGSAGADTLMSHKGGNCPNLVATATTKVTLDDKKGTVTVEISATDKNAIATIQARTKAWKDRKKDDSGSGTHDAKGGQGGEEGMCPIAVPNFEVADAKDTKDGVKISLKLDADGAKKEAGEKAALLGEVKVRADKAAAWMKDNLKAEPGGQGGTGDGGGKHGRDHSGKGDAKGKDEGGGGSGTGGGGGKGTGGGGGSGGKTK